MGANLHAREARMARLTTTRSSFAAPTLLAAALAAGGCFLSHERSPGSAPPPGARDSGIDAGKPRADAGLAMDAGVDAAPTRDASRRDRRPPGTDAGPGTDAAPVCAAPSVSPFPEDDLCAPEVGECIEDCGTRRLCIASCFEGHPRCRDCAVRNAVACFNAEGCREHWPDAYCCAARSCGIERAEDVLNACTVVTCFDELDTYADCAVRRADLRCREAIAECGLPPTLLGLDG